MSMKKLYISIISGLLLCFVFSSTVYAQWSFTIQSFSWSGQCAGVMPPYPIGYKAGPFTNKNECESVRQSFAISSSYGGCTVTINCSTCTGSDITTPNRDSNQSSPGSLNINGTSQGSAFFSSSPSKETIDWMNNVTQKHQSLGISNNVSNFIPATGNKDFDVMYGNLIKDAGKNEEFTVLPKGSGSSGVVLDDTKGLTVKDPQRGLPVAPELDSKILKIHMQINDTERLMQNLLEELSRMQRFCNSPYLNDDGNCSYYQEKIEKAEQKLQEVKDKLIELKSKEYQSEIDKYNIEIKHYEEEKDKCQLVTCVEDIDRTIAEINERKNNASEKIEKVQIEINNMNSYAENDISYAEQQCEIATEMIKRGNVVAGNELLDKYAPIVAVESASKVVKEGMSDRYVRTTTVDAMVDNANFGADMVSLFSTDNGTLRDIAKEGIKSVVSDGIKKFFGTGETGNIMANALQNSIESAAEQGAEKFGEKIGEKVPVVGKIFQGIITIKSSVTAAKSTKTAANAWVDFLGW